MNAGELKKAKRAVRRTVLAARDALPGATRARLATRIHARFLDLPEVRVAGTVLLYWSFGSEVPTADLIVALRARGTLVTLPRIVDDDLEIRTWSPGDPLTETSFGAREPAAGEVVDPAEVEVIATPSVAFDRAGRRVGYGGGFYDRLLPRTQAVRIGLAFGVQLVDGSLPAGPFDERMDVVVTEEETLRWAR